MSDEVNQYDSEIKGENQVTESESNKKPTRSTLSEESYLLIREAQEQIFIATEATPSFRKLVNLLVTPENLAKITERLIDNLK